MYKVNQLYRGGGGGWGGGGGEGTAVTSVCSVIPEPE